MEPLKIRTRRNFDDIFAEKSAEIDKMSLNEVKERREYLKSWLSNIEELGREEGITNGRKMYLRGLRKVAVNLLKHSKDRVKLINSVVCNGTTIDHASRFVRCAAEILPQETFQRIYGLSLSAEEKEKMTIESVKEFMNRSENVAKYEVNGNVINEKKRSDYGNNTTRNSGADLGMLQRNNVG